MIQIIYLEWPFEKILKTCEYVASNVITPLMIVTLYHMRLNHPIIHMGHLKSSLTGEKNNSSVIIKS